METSRNPKSALQPMGISRLFITEHQQGHNHERSLQQKFFSLSSQTLIALLTRTCINQPGEFPPVVVSEEFSNEILGPDSWSRVCESKLEQVTSVKCVGNVGGIRRAGASRLFGPV